MQRIVWMESMTTRSGFSFSIRPQISSTSFSAARKMLSCGTFSRAARSLTCRTDSSPVIYKTLCWLEMAPHSCRSIVDLPTPGSPLKSTTPPSTMPPPSTRSSSEMPVRIRLFSSVILIFRKAFCGQGGHPFRAGGCRLFGCGSTCFGGFRYNVLVHRVPAAAAWAAAHPAGACLAAVGTHIYSFQFWFLHQKAPVTLSWFYCSLL